MLESLMVLAAIGAVYYIFVWSVQNDGARDIADQRGLLRMAPPPEDSAPDAAAESKGAAEGEGAAEAEERADAAGPQRGRARPWMREAARNPASRKPGQDRAKRGRRAGRTPR